MFHMGSFMANWILFELKKPLFFPRAAVQKMEVHLSSSTKINPESYINAPVEVFWGTNSWPAVLSTPQLLLPLVREGFFTEAFKKLSAGFHKGAWCTWSSYGNYSLNSVGIRMSTR